MFGGIYSDRRQGQKCPECGGKFIDNHKDGLVCPDHPQYRATKMFVKFGKTKRTFYDYRLAQKFLTGLRFQADEGAYDPMDWQKGQPLGFRSLSQEYVKKRSDIWSKKHCMNSEACLDAGAKIWKNKNIKTFRINDFDNYLSVLKGASDKTRFNHLGIIKAFFKWCFEYEYIDILPKFPKVSFEERHRKPTTAEVQDRILAEVYRLTWHINPRIYIGIKTLAVCFAIRPKELLSITGRDIDFEMGTITIQSCHCKTKRQKDVPIPDEILDLFRSLPETDMPDLPFFRHAYGSGQQFGEKYFYKWWKKACENLGIKDIPLYPGTAHTTILKKRLEGYTPEELRMAAMRRTNKAFSHYFEMPLDDVRAIYSAKQTFYSVPESCKHEKINSRTLPESSFEPKESAKLLKLKK